MITKGYVEELVSSNQVKVRLPVYDKINENGTGAGFNELPIASVCSLPSTNPNLKVGDVVYVAFEDNNRQKPIVMGYLSMDNNKYCDTTLQDLTVNGTSRFTSDFSIGNIDYNSFLQLKNVKVNIQNYLDKLSDSIDKLEEKLEKSNKNNEKNNAKLLNESNKYNKALQYLDLIKGQIGSNQDNERDKTLFGQLYAAENIFSILENKVGAIAEGESIISLLNSLSDRVAELEDSFSKG